MASTTAQAAGSKAKLKDFVLRWWTPPAAPDAEWHQTLAGFRALAARQSEGPAG